MQVAEGILTARGGDDQPRRGGRAWNGQNAASQDARRMNIDYAAGTMSADGKVVHRGEYITLDGSAGEVIEGRVPTVDPEMPPFSKSFSPGPMPNASSVSAPMQTLRTTRMSRANSAPRDWLCRTEHMFFRQRANLGGCGK